MDGGIPSVRRLVRGVRRRAFARDFVAFFLHGLGGTLTCALVWMVAARLSGGVPEASWQVLAGGSVVAGVLFGLVMAGVRRWSAHRAAMEVDRTFGLRDRVSTGLELAVSRDGFAMLLVEDAERAARGLRPSQAVDVFGGVRPWAVWEVVGAIGVGVAVQLWMPRAADVDETPLAQQAPTAETKSLVREVMKQAEEAAPLPEAAGADVPRDEAVAALERELAAGTLDDASARAKAAAIADRTAERLATKAAEDQAKSDAVRSELSAAARRASEGTGEAERTGSELTDALRRGDAARAAEAVQELSKRLPRMSKEEREDLARELEALEKGLEPPATEPGEAADVEAGEPATGEPGPEPDTPKARDHTGESVNTPDGRAEPTTEPAKGNAQEPAEPAAARGRKITASESLREALRESREQVSQERPPPSGDATTPPSDSPKDGVEKPANESGESRESSPQPNAEKRTGEAAAEKPDAKPDGTAKPTPAEGEQKPSPVKKDTRTTPLPGSPQKGSQEPPKSNEGAATESRPTQGEKQSGEKGEKSGEQGDQPSGQPSPQPGDRPGEQPSDQPDSMPGEKPAEGVRPGFERLVEELRKVAERERGAQRSAEDAQRLREQGQKLLEQLSPQERQELQRLAREFGEKQGKPPQGTPDGQPPEGQVPQGASPDGDDQRGENPEGRPRPGENGQPRSNVPPAPDGTSPYPQPGNAGAERGQQGTRPGERGAIRPELTRREGNQDGTGGGGEGEGRGEAVPAREDRTGEGEATRIDPSRPGENERPIAELAKDESPDGGGVSSPSLAPALRRAAQSAERSIEQRTVPSQYSDLVRRVFKRYVDRSAAPPK